MSRFSWRVSARLCAVAACVLGGPPIFAEAPARPISPAMAAGSKQISGVVLDDQGHPVAGLTVGLTWHWSRTQKDGQVFKGEATVRQVKTDALGRFTIPGLPAGDYTYGVWSDPERFIPVRAALTLAASDTGKTLRVTVSPGSLITGRVVDGLTGKPLAHVFIAAGPVPPGGDLAKWDWWEIESEGQTDAQGRYETRVPPGETFVGVGRITNNTPLSRRIRSLARKVTAVRGQTVSAPDLPVSLKPMLVYLGPDGLPVANAPVRLVPSDLAKVPVITEGRTDDAGAIILDQDQLQGQPTEDGHFRIAQGARTASGAFHWVPGGPLTVTADGETRSFPDGVGTVRLSDGAAGLITGTVTTLSGRPVPGARVRVVEIDPQNHSAVEDHVFQTDAAGVFRGPLDPHGEYHAYVRADGFNQVAVTGDRPTPITKGVTTDVGTVRLTRADGSVSGRVVDGLGRPMRGVLASVRGGKTFLSAAVTDAKGRFRIPNVVPGEPLTLNLCRQGEAPDSGSALSQSNEEMQIPQVEASPAEPKIVWHPRPQ